MQLGTAGFTAALAIHRMEQNDQQPDQGPILVTGATGGVGSMAVDMLARRGYSVTALTGKPEAGEYLRALGAAEILDRGQLELGTRPLEKALWAGAVDNLGGDLLGWLTRTTMPYGNIASIGLAAGFELHTTVMPFILRGVNLLGINSVAVPRALRLQVWERMAQDLRPVHLDRIAHREVGLEALKAQFQAYVDSAVVGRTIVRLN
jgi:NADPH2:quinone reductase